MTKICQSKPRTGLFEDRLPERRKNTRRQGGVTPRLILALIVVVLVIWCLPRVLRHTRLVSWIAKRAATDVDGRVEVRSASLGWFSPIELHGLKIIDREGHPVVDVPEIQGDRPLAAIVWDAANLGRFRLKSPKFALVLRSDGSNVRDVFAKYLDRERKQWGVALGIVDGSVSVDEQVSERTWQIDHFNLDLILPADRSRPWQLTASGSIAGTPKVPTSTRIKSGQVQLALSGRTGQERTAWKGRLELSNLAASIGGLSVRWKEPISVALAVRQTAHGPVFDEFKLDSSLLCKILGRRPGQPNQGATAQTVFPLTLVRSDIGVQPWIR